MSRSGVLTEFERRQLRAVCDAIIPSGGTIPEGALEVGVPELLEGWLARFSPQARRLVRAMLGGYSLTPLLSQRPRPFARLDSGERERWAAESDRSRFRLRRESFMGLHTLVTIAYASTPQVRERLGWDGSPAVPVDWSTVAPQPSLPVTQWPEIRDEEVSCDVVIVGSGAGGSLAARELVAAGLNVVIVEEGGAVMRDRVRDRLPVERLFDAYRDAVPHQQVEVRGGAAHREVALRVLPGGDRSVRSEADHPLAVGVGAVQVHRLGGAHLQGAGAPERQPEVADLVDAVHGQLGVHGRLGAHGVLRVPAVHRGLQRGAPHPEAHRLRAVAPVPDLLVLVDAGQRLDQPGGALLEPGDARLRVGGAAGDLAHVDGLAAAGAHDAVRPAVQPADVVDQVGHGPARTRRHGGGGIAACGGGQRRAVGPQGADGELLEAHGRPVWHGGAAAQRRLP